MKMDMKMLALFCFGLNYTFAFGGMPSLCACVEDNNVYDELGENRGGGLVLQCNREKQYAKVFEMDLPQKQKIISLWISNTDITSLNSKFFGPFLQRRIIRKLDFSDNAIELIEDGTFWNFTNVAILKLSNNRMTKLTNGMFKGLNELRRLYLNDNSISVLPRSVFSALNSLDLIDLNQNPIVCNCLLKEFVRWRSKYVKKKRKSAGDQKKSSKFKLQGACIYPQMKSGEQLNKVRQKHLDCSTNLDSLPHFVLSPDESQVVFSNDSISLRCEATDLMVNGTVMSWKLNGVLVSETRFSNRSLDRFLSISYNVPQITEKHAGVWECQIQSKKILLNLSTSVTLTVLESNAQYCQSDVQDGSKGLFQWPRSVTGVTTELECGRCDEKMVDNITSMVVSGERIDHSCLLMVKEMVNRTDIKYKTAVVMPLIDEFYSSCFHQMLIYPDSANSRIGFQREYLHVLSRIMDIPVESIVANNITDDVLLRSRHAISQTAKFIFDTIPFQPLKNLNLTVLKVPEAGEVAVCDLSDGKWEDQKKRDLKDKPRVVIESLKSNSKKMEKQQEQELAVAVFANANLFNSKLNHHLPIPLNQSNITVLANKRKKFQENPNLLADANMDEFSNIYLISPVYWVKRMKNDSFKLNVSITGIYSNYRQVHLCRREHQVWRWSNDRWMSADPSICRTVSVEGKTPDEKPLHGFTCTQTGVYAVVLNISAEDEGKELKSNLFVAVSACVFTLSLLFIMATQVIFSSKLKSTRERRHILISTLVHMITAVMSFSFGIWKTNRTIPCYITGITIHYSTLSVLMWIAISTKLICRDVRSLEKPRSSEARKNKPLLRFYLVACGVPAIICSITAATNIENYLGDDRRYCWLSWKTSLYAFYLPAVAISIACIYKFIRALTSLTRAYKKNYSDPSNLRGPIISQNGSSCHNGTINEETPLRQLSADYKQSDESSAYKHRRTPTYELRTHRARLCGAALPLTSLIVLWVFAGFSVAAAFFQENEKDSWKLLEPTLCWVELNGSRRLTFEIIFSCSCVLFSLLHLIHHIYLRKEAWQSWKGICCYKKKGEQVGVVYHSSDGNLNPISQPGDASTNVTDVPTTEATIPLDVNNKKTKDSDKFRHEQQQYTSSPATTTFGGEDYVAASEKDCNSYSALNQQNSTVIVHQYQGKSKTSTSNSKISSHCKSTCSSTHISNQGSSYMTSSYRHGRSSRASDNSSCQQPAAYCYQYNCPLPTNRCRPLKLTNLKYQRYMKQRAANGDHQDLLKKNVGHLDTRFLAQRHSRVRKALEERRKNQKKLTVLREHAQDSLTSNDEGAQVDRRMRELPQSEQAAVSSRIAETSNERGEADDPQQAPIPCPSRPIDDASSWARGNHRKPHGYLTVSGLFRIQKPPAPPSQSPSAVTSSDLTQPLSNNVLVTTDPVNRDDVLPADSTISPPARDESLF